jgi:hypothetical protein
MSEQITEDELLIRNLFRAIHSQEDGVPLLAFALGAAEVNTQLRDMRQLATELAEMGIPCALVTSSPRRMRQAPTTASPPSTTASLHA